MDIVGTVLQGNIRLTAFCCAGFWQVWDGLLKTILP